MIIVNSLKARPHSPLNIAAGATIQKTEKTTAVASKSTHETLAFRPWKMIATILVSTMSLEALIMLALNNSPFPLSSIQEIFFDTVLLGFLLSLILYYFIFYPLQKKQHNLHQDLSKALHEISIFDAEFAHKLLHDELTGLANRFLFHDRLEHEIVVSERAVSSFALLFIDPGSLSTINETLGHKAGDQVIIDISKRLTGLIRKSDTLARMGSDEFALLMPTVDTEQVHFMAERIHKAFEMSFMVDELEVDITAQIGIALFPLHAANSIDLMRRADLAMRQAKRDLLPSLVYNKKHESNILSKREAYHELRRAVNEGDFELYFQPKMDLQSNQIKSVEALVRLRNNPNVSPAEFIPLAEQTGLINKLSAWVLEHAIKQLKIWESQSIDVNIAVNISARNILDPNFTEHIKSLLTTHAVHHSKLSLELTESMMMENPKVALTTLQQLNDAGFHMAIDDYGTGYSSLSYLQQLPVQELKIDQSFVRNILENQRNTAIVSSTILLAHSLGMTVVAEGVEDIHISNHLAKLGCDKAQGYYINRPLNEVDFIHWYQSLEHAIFRA